MLQCPECGMRFISQKIDSCMRCGVQLDPIQNRQSEDADSITLLMDFTVQECDGCGMVNPYDASECSSCHARLLDASDKPSSVNGLDPSVAARQRKLSRLVAARATMLEDLEQAVLSRATVRLDVDEEHYRTAHIEVIELFAEQTGKLRDFLRSTDFSEEAVAAPHFHAHIAVLEQEYHRLLDLTKKALRLEPPPIWAELHAKSTSAIEQACRSYLDAVDVLVSPDPLQASDLMTQISEQLREAGQTLESLKLVFAGKSLRYGLASGVPEAVAPLVAEGLNMSSLWDMGWDYFESLFSRSISEIPDEYGFVLALWAIIVESFNDPILLKRRAAVVTDVCRRADAADRLSLKSVMDRLEQDTLHCGRLLASLGFQFAATDFSQLQTQHFFDMAVHAYQRLSEGAFKNLLTFLLFCEDLVAGGSPDYDRISRQNFGPRVKRLQHSSEPLIAGLADDLVMYIRHADAHCDFQARPDKLIVNERHFRTKQILASREYNADEFTDLIQRLLEAVFAIFVGIGCFEIEFHEEYKPSIGSELFDSERFELVKYFYAVYGLVVQSIDTVDSNGAEPGLAISAELAKDVDLTPEIVLTPTNALLGFFPNLHHVEILLYDANQDRLGRLVIPMYHYRRFEGPGRHGELILLDLRYKTMTEYSDPPSLLHSRWMSDTEVYLWNFLKPVSIYLAGSLQDCYAVVQSASTPSLDHVKALDRELATMQQVLASNKPPRAFRDQHALAIRAAGMLRKSTLALSSSLRSRALAAPAEVEELLQKASLPVAELRAFVRDSRLE